MALGEYRGKSLVIVLTNEHVIRNARTNEVTVYFGNQTNSRATIIEVDPIQDLAALLAHDKGAGVVELASEISLGDRLTWAGFGAGNYAEGVGVFQNTETNIQRTSSWIRLSNTRNRSGDSGGPIFTTSGKMAGVMWGGASDGVRGSGPEPICTFLTKACRRLSWQCPCKKHRKTLPNPAPTPQQQTSPQLDIEAIVRAVVEQLPKGPKGDTGDTGPSGEPAKLGKVGFYIQFHDHQRQPYGVPLYVGNGQTLNLYPDIVTPTELNQ